jgi:5-methylcytosine-specific restriction endonuclease McrA
MTKVGRLFTGPMRDAVLMLATRCTHPGWTRPVTDCHIDHLVPHSAGGETSVTNGAPACSHHNNWRYTSGARTRLQPTGRWSTHRPNGTDIAPPD